MCSSDLINLKPLFEKRYNKYILKSSQFDRFEFINQKEYDNLNINLTDGIPQLDFFTMSFCEYSNEAEKEINKVKEVLRKAKFVPHYITYVNYSSDGCVEDLCSMHGKQELTQEMREKCAFNLGYDVWFNFSQTSDVMCNQINADKCWFKYNTLYKSTLNKIKTCQEEQGIELLKSDKIFQDKFDVRGSPTLFIDGHKYLGKIEANAIFKEMCKSFDVKPLVCSTDELVSEEVIGRCN